MHRQHPLSETLFAARGWWPWMALLAITAVAAWARLEGLGSWGFWRDEAQCIFIAQKAFPQGIVAALRHEAHPPLYYALQHFWISLVGWSELRIRLLSAAGGIITVPALFLVGRRLFGVAAGLGAALVGALAPLHVAVSQTARMYSLLALLSALSVWFLYEAWERGRGWWVGYVLVSAGVLYTHNWGLFLLVAQAGWAVWRLARQSTWRTRLVPWALAQAAIAVIYLPWALNVLEQIKIIMVLPFIPIPTPAEKLWQLAGDLLVRGPALFLWLATLALGLWPRRRSASVPEADGALSLVLFCSLGALVIGLLVSLQTYGQAPAYVTMAAFPALCLLLGRGMSRLKPAWLALPLALLVVVTALPGRDDLRFTFKSTLREVAWTVQSQAGPDDVIVVAPDYLATTFNTYYRGSQAQVAFPWVMRRLEEIDCVGWNDRWYRAAEAVPATLAEVEARLGATGRVWLIAAPDDFPADERYYGQIRRLKSELDARYQLERTFDEFRNATEWATIAVYARGG